LWLREDEFDKSLSLDTDYYFDLKEKVDYWTAKLQWYEHDLATRRDKAHRLDMEREDKSQKPESGDVSHT
jgi:hypothetical protein